jgi:hypothetical protein
MLQAAPPAVANNGTVFFRAENDKETPLVMPGAGPDYTPSDEIHL